MCYSTALDSTDMFTSGKVTDKMETEKAKVNLEVDRARLLGEKNSLVAKREEL